MYTISIRFDFDSVRRTSEKMYADINRYSPTKIVNPVKTKLNDIELILFEK